MVRSSSNAEDLPGFSAAGIYESVNHVTTADALMDSVKAVWASLLSPRSVRLRQQAGISLDDAYMGVIIQEEVAGDTRRRPGDRRTRWRASDFRNVYLNVSARSVVDVVSGTPGPMQYLYNTVEGGGRTVALGDAEPTVLDDATQATAWPARPDRPAAAGALLAGRHRPTRRWTSSGSVDGDTDRARCSCRPLLQLEPHERHRVHQPSPPPIPPRRVIRRSLQRLPVSSACCVDAGLLRVPALGGLGRRQIFGIQSIYYVAFCLFEIPTGLLADRIGSRHCLPAGAVVLTAANLVPIAAAHATPGSSSIPADRAGAAR